mmetsp:Transcript_39332/g.113829  ORF Transcript_39332/g.113829 Transcript_39332/m.113829 type:complete len:603 (+) Transcript_39332:98-1906(+)
MLSGIFSTLGADKVAAKAAGDAAAEHASSALEQGHQKVSEVMASGKSEAAGYAARAASLFASANNNANAAHHSNHSEKAHDAAPAAGGGGGGDAGAGTATFGAHAADLLAQGRHGVTSSGAALSEKGQELLAAGHDAAALVHARTISGLSHLGGAMPLLTKDRLDLSMLSGAGFGATGLNLERRRAEAYDAMFVMAGPLRMQLLLALREMVKESAGADPEMPDCVRDQIHKLVDRFWTDIIVYQEKLIEDAKQAALGRAAIDHAELALLGPHLITFSPFWWRAHILYHYLPFDKSLFGNMRNPMWWILTVLSMLPAFGIRIIFHTVLLILILRGCPPDEYQLVSFILGFKGTQVISSGVVMSIVACTKLYMCIHSQQHHTCNIDGPGMSDNIYWGIVDLLGSWILVCVAFLALPCSRPHAGSRDLDGEIANMDDGASAAGTEFTISDNDSDGSTISIVRRSFYSACNFKRCCRRCDPSRGGRLAGLLAWDITCNVLSAALLVWLAQMDLSQPRPGVEPATEVPLEDLSDVGKVLGEDFKHWQFRMAFFMTRIFSGYLSLPFVLFQLPVLNSILTHTRPTGFNHQGVCVPFMLPPMPPKTKGH